MAKEMGIWGWVAMGLTIVGALNWGLVGALNMNLVTIVFGSIHPILVQIVYILVGLSGIFTLYKTFV